jgi:hypothetical protein
LCRIKKLLLRVVTTVRDAAGTFLGSSKAIDEAIIEGPGSMVLGLSFLSTAVCGISAWFERHRSYNATFTPSFNFMVAG